MSVDDETQDFEPGATDPLADEDEPMVRVRVADATQVAFGGNVYGAGDTFEAPAAEAAVWIRHRWAVLLPPETEPARGRRR